MPTYEYACRSCDTHLEVVQRFDEQPLTECPTCGGSLRKVFGSIGIAFKGSGFYKTDSRALGKTATAASAKGEGGKEAAPAGSGSSESSTDGTKAGAGASTKDGGAGAGSAASTGSESSSSSAAKTA